MPGSISMSDSEFSEFFIHGGGQISNGAGQWEPIYSTAQRNIFDEPDPTLNNPRDFAPRRASATSGSTMRGATGTVAPGSETTAAPPSAGEEPPLEAEGIPSLKTLCLECISRLCTSSLQNRLVGTCEATQDMYVWVC